MGAGLVETGEYAGAAREEIARGMGALLSYPEDKVSALLSSTATTPTQVVTTGRSAERVALADRWRGRWPTDPLSAEPIRLRRSVLYRLGVGQEPDAYERAPQLQADVLLFEIEDSVPPADKASARMRVVDVLRNGQFGAQERIVTVNGLETPWGADDLAALAAVPGLDGINVAKCESAETLRQTDAILRQHGAPATVKLFAMIETPKGLAAVAEIAAAVPGRLAGLTVGLGDLARGLNAFRLPTPHRLPVLPALASVVLAARANGMFPNTTDLIRQIMGPKSMVRYSRLKYI